MMQALCACDTQSLINYIRRMLLQLEHEHKGKEQPSSPPKLDQIGSSRVTRKPEIIQEPQSIFFIPQPHLETASFNFHTDGLEELRRESLIDLPVHVVGAIQERKRFSEERVYQAIVQTSADFVGIHMRDFKTGLKIEMQAMFEAVHNTVEAGIWDGRYQINESRNKYFSLAKKENQLLSFITGQLVKRNLDSFRQELDDDELASETQDFNSHKARSENYRTRAAEDFVKKMKEEQQRHQAEINRQIEERKMNEFRAIEQRKAREEERKREKQELVRRRVQRQSQILGIQKQRRQKIHSEYLKMVSSHRKPLYQESQERYNKSVMEEQKRKFKMMQDLKEKKRPINFDEIQDHIIKYEELLEENESFRQQKRELKESQYEIIASKRPYRSKFYSLTLKEGARSEQEREMKTSLLKKQEDYADHVKKNFMPKTDESKQQELEELIKRVENQKKHNYHSRKYMEEGKRNLEKLHLLIAELRAKHRLKENISIQEIMKQKEPSKRYKNYLEQIKQAKTTQDSGNFQKKLDNKSHQQIHLLSLQREQRARQKQQYLNSSIEDIDIHSHMKGKVKVEQDYLEAAKAKMAILRKYNLDGEGSPS